VTDATTPATPVARVEAIGAYLARVGGESAPGDIGAAVPGLNHRTQAVSLNTMRAAGLIEGPRNWVRFTPAGWARFGGVTAEGAGEVLDRVLDGWPYTHRAFLELLVSTVIARHHLGARRRTGHLGFIAIGETGTGKSAMGGLVCHLFGFPPALHTLHLPTQAAGSLLGRREQDGDGWRWVPAATTRLPFVVLDEFDKAEDAVQRRAWVHLHDALDQQLEGQVHELLPTPLLLANPPRSGFRYAQLRQEYRRRSVVLDTRAMAGRSGELEDLLARFYATTTPADRLSLERLAPPADRLGPDALEVLKMARDQALTQAGREEFPTVRVLELTTLGRMALMGPNADEQVAAYATAVAYLQATESVPGQVLERWGPDVAAVRAALGQGGEAIATALERSRAERAAAAQEAVRGRQRKARAELETIEHGARLAEELRQLITALDGRKVAPADKAAAAGLRKALRILATSAAQVSTRASLLEVAEKSYDVQDRARALVAAQGAARVATDQARRDAAEQARRQKTQDKAMRESARRAAAAHRRETGGRLALVVESAKPLEDLWRRTTTRDGEDVLARLAELEVNGRPVLVYQPPAERPRERGLAGFLDRLAPESGTWRVNGAAVAFPGTRWRCAALASWGPNTRAVLAPALAMLHQVEDQLRAELGRAPRERRPVVPAAAAAPVRQQIEPAGWVPSGPARYGMGR